MRCRARHDHEPVLGKPRDCQVRLDATAIIQPLRVDNLANGNIDVVGADVIEVLRCVFSFDKELTEGRLIKKHHVTLQPVGLELRAGEPVLPSVGIGVLWLHAITGIPVRPFVTIHLSEHGAQFLGLSIERRTPDAARRFGLPVRPVHGIEKPQRLRDTLADVGLVRLERMDAADVDAIHIHGWMAILDPL